MFIVCSVHSDSIQETPDGSLNGSVKHCNRFPISCLMRDIVFEIKRSDTQSPVLGKYIVDFVQTFVVW